MFVEKAKQPLFLHNAYVTHLLLRCVLITLWIGNSAEFCITVIVRERHRGLLYESIKVSDVTFITALS